MNHRAPDGPALSQVARHYDRVMYMPAYKHYHDDTDFGNFGWWDARTRTQREACETLMERLLAFVPDRCGRVLDVACGKGATTQHLSRYYRADQVTSINISGKQLETARENAPGCQFVLMDAAHLGFDDGVFNAVVCVEAAFHFDTREAFLREVRRVLKPGGHLVLTDALVTREAEQRRPLRTERNYLEGPVEYRALCERLGFVDVQVLDATAACWHGCFRYVTRFAHEKYLRREIAREEMERLLESVYGWVPDLTYYVVVAAQNPPGGARA